MDQRVLAGIGNIYANEASGAPASIRRARRIASPSTRPRAFATRSSTVLTESIARAARASATTATRAASAGDFVEQLAAYGRAGEPCLRCGAGSSGRTRSTDGSTVLCAHCQK